MPTTVISVPIWDVHNPHHTRNFIDQMFKFVEGNWLLVIVDNCSPNLETQEMLFNLRDVDERLVIIQNPENYGYGRAANQGINYGFQQGCEYGIVLNNDIQFRDPHWIENAFVNDLREHKDWLVGARLIIDNGLTNFGNGCIPYLEGYALAFHRDLWNTIQGFDPVFLTYFEDLDICYRARRAGFSLVQSAAFLWTSDGNISVANFVHGALYHVGGQTGYHTPGFNWQQVTIDSARYFQKKWGFPKLPIAEWENN